MSEKLYTKKECKQKAQAVERDIKRKFDWNVKVTIQPDGTFNWDSVGKNRDRYDLYPGLTREQADIQVMKDILNIFRAYLPGATLTDYTQHGERREWRG